VSGRGTNDGGDDFVIVFLPLGRGNDCHDVSYLVLFVLKLGVAPHLDPSSMSWQYTCRSCIGNIGLLRTNPR